MKGEFAVQLDDAVVEVVGDVGVAGRVERDAVGKAELARARAVRARRGLVDPVRIEFLDAVVVVIGDEHLAGVGGEAARIGELARAGALAAPRHRFAAAEREALDAVVARVGHVDVAAGYGDAAPWRLRGVL